MKILVTGATGKVGSRMLQLMRSDPRFKNASFRALCHNRSVDGVEIVRGTIADRACVKQALEGVSHVVHLATCKETPEDVMDVAVKGLFWMLEEFTASKTAKQFILIGGDAAIGHFFYEHDGPITEATKHMAYPGCYALSKVLEEVLVTQFHTQYGINTCCLRAPWIMEKDDFKFTLSFGDDVFGGPVWKNLIPAEDAARYRENETIPVLLDAHGKALKRNFVHIDDLVAAIALAIDNPKTKGKTFNISMNEPVDYADVASHLKRTFGLSSVEIPSQYHSNWMDNSAAKYALGWRPNYDLAKLIDSAWHYKRSPDEPRKIWYPG